MIRLKIDIDNFFCRDIVVNQKTTNCHSKMLSLKKISHALTTLSFISLMIVATSVVFLSSARSESHPVIQLLPDLEIINTSWRWDGVWFPTLEIRNNGPGTAVLPTNGDLKTRIVLEDQTVNRETLFATNGDPLSLGSGESILAWVSFAGMGTAEDRPDGKPVSFMVDSTNIIFEHDEGNNTFRTFVPTRSSPENLLKNPSFDTGRLHPWEQEDHRGVASFNLDGGNRVQGAFSLMISQPYAGVFYQTQIKQIVPIEAGRQYAISFWAKSDGSYPLIVEWHKDTLPFSNYGLWQEITVGTEWRKYEYVFYATSSDPNARFALDLGAGSGTIWLDNARILTSDAPASYPPELIWNGGFEAGSYFNWRGFSSLSDGSIVTDELTPSGGGEFSVKLFNPRTGPFYQTQLYQSSLNIQEGRSYRLTFWARADHNGHRLTTELTKMGAPWSNYGLWQEHSLTTSWRKYVAFFVATHSDLNARLDFGIGNSAGNVWLDNVSLKQN